MSVAFKGFNEKSLTFNTSQTIENGSPVSMASNGAVAKTTTGNAFIGIAGSQRDDIVEVQLCGYVKASYSSTAPGVGTVTLGADGSGGVKVVSSGGTSCLVVSVNETDHTVEFIF